MRTAPSITLDEDFEDSGCDITANGIGLNTVSFIQTTSSASSAASNISKFSSDAEL